MSGIRGKDTKPEMIFRRAFHALGFRYRLHPRNVPGKPDLVFPKYRAVLLVHGCFWHGHDCHLFRMPGTRRQFWQAKISRNRERDAEVRQQLGEAGWRYMTVWECAIRGPGKLGAEIAIERVNTWLLGGSGNCELRGATAGGPS